MKKKTKVKRTVVYFLLPIIILSAAIYFYPSENKPLTKESVENQFQPYGHVIDFIKADLRGTGQVDTVAILSVQRHDLGYKLFDSPSWHLPSHFWKVLVWSTQDGKNTLLWQNGAKGIYGNFWGKSFGVVSLSPAEKPYIVLDAADHLIFYQWNGQSFAKVFDIPMDSQIIDAQKMSDKKTAFLIDDDSAMVGSTKPMREIYLFENGKLTKRSNKYPEFYRGVVQELKKDPDAKAVCLLSACLYTGSLKEGMVLSEKILRTIPPKDWHGSVEKQTIYRFRGDVYMNSGLRAKAIEEYRKANLKNNIETGAKGDPKDIESAVVECMGDYYLKYGADYQKALNCYKKAQKLTSNPWPYHYNGIIEKAQQAIKDGCIALHGIYLLPDQ
jgi:hypothetical protein